jgi:membrane dipeptidase
MSRSCRSTRRPANGASKAWQVANMQIDAIGPIARRTASCCCARGDVERLRTGGRVLLALGWENGAPIGDDLSQLAAFHARGVPPSSPQPEQPHQ